MRESCEIIVVAILKRWSCRQLKLCLRKRDRQFVIQLFSQGRLNAASVGRRSQRRHLPSQDVIAFEAIRLA